MRKREGIEPRHGYFTVDADAVLFTEGHIKGAHPAMAPANPPGSKTVARHQGSVGNSGDPLGSSRDGSRVAQPAYRKQPHAPEEVGLPAANAGKFTVAEVAEIITFLPWS